jgi:predicted ribosomally synthesized peptide with nif11-like leader
MVLRGRVMMGHPQPTGSMSRSQLNAFMVKVEADPSLRARVDAAADAEAVAAIALSEGHLFSPASWSRYARG